MGAERRNVNGVPRDVLCQRTSPLRSTNLISWEKDSLITNRFIASLSTLQELQHQPTAPKRCWSVSCNVQEMKVCVNVRPLFLSLGLDGH